MAKKTVNPTRMELTGLKGKLKMAMRGHKLLKDKRDELMKKFLDLVRENKALRENVEKALKRANANFALASASMSGPALNVALVVPARELDVELKETNIMSVKVPEYEITAKSQDSMNVYTYGYAFTSAELDDCVEVLAGIMPELLRLAQIEKTCQLMAGEIEKTRRRVNALEHVMIPEYQQNIRYISMKLDENERSTQSRLMKVKDMLLEETYHYDEKLHSKD